MTPVPLCAQTATRGTTEEGLVSRLTTRRVIILILVAAGCVLAVPGVACAQ